MARYHGGLEVDEQDHKSCLNWECVLGDTLTSIPLTSCNVSCSLMTHMHTQIPKT